MQNIKYGKGNLLMNFFQTNQIQPNPFFGGNTESFAHELCLRGNAPSSSRKSPGMKYRKALITIEIQITHDKLSFMTNITF